MTKQATSKTYREAARRIAEGENARCCFAIGNILKSSCGIANGNDAPLFYELYSNSRDTTSWWWLYSKEFPYVRHYRVIALLLAAEIWEDENLNK